MEPNTSNLVPHFKPDIKLSIDLNASTISGIQATYATLLKGKTKEDADALKSRIEAKGQLSEWDFSVITMTNLMNNIFDLARSTEQVEYKTLEDSLGSVTLTV